MDNNFQTSFIPKKPLAQDKRSKVRKVSLFGFLATLIFFASLIAGGGVYLYKNSLTQRVSQMQRQLDAARNAFEPSLITELQRLDRRINAANGLLAQHIAVTPIFDALEADTLKSIRFTRFSYATPTDLSSPIMIRMNGVARDYTSIALQSDQFSKNRNILDPIFSNLSLDERTGNVTFDLSFRVNSDFVRFSKHLAGITGPQASNDASVSIQ